MLIDDARTLLQEWVQSDSLRKHCEAVSSTLRYFARRDGQDEDLWGAVGLLHDMDFERYPDMPERGPTTTAVSEAILNGGELPETLPGHPFYGVVYLGQNGWSKEVQRAILTHADYSGVEPESQLERTLFAVDELSGFVTAVALVRPSKSVHDVDVKSVRKKMKDKAFAAKVNRNDIIRGAELLNVELDVLIGEVIKALQADADHLGLAGIQAA